MVYLREANQEDIDLIFEWANDCTVRENSFNSAPIQYEDHIRWFNRIIKDKDVLQFVLMDDEIPVGQIRLNISDEEAEIGYSIAPKFRGKGYGHKILKLMKEEVKEKYPSIKTLVAKVKPGNVASNKLFEDEGYEMKYVCYTIRTQSSKGEYM